MTLLLSLPDIPVLSIGVSRSITAEGTVTAHRNGGIHPDGTAREPGALPCDRSAPLDHKGSGRRDAHLICEEREAPIPPPVPP
jgi:hypothetical protein